MKRLLLILLISLLICPIFAQGLGYALSGGGARGFAHIGILKVLEEEDLRPDYIAGTSLGAVVGALYSLGYNAVEIENLVIDLDWSILSAENLPRNDLYIGQKRWTPVGSLEFELEEGFKPIIPSSVMRVNGINLKLFEIFSLAAQEQDFDCFPIPFRAVATNIETGEARHFSKGSLMQAVRASISVPSILIPFKIGDDTYIDGGISQNLPIEALQEMGADFIIGSKVNSSLKSVDELKSIVDILDQTINIGMTRNLTENIDFCDLLLEPDLGDISSTEFKNIKEIIAIGEAYARKNIDMIRHAVSEYHSTASSKEIRQLQMIDKYHISRIQVINNESISPAKVREYLGLQLDKEYSVADIIAASKRLWNSDYFHVVYPELISADEGSYLLNIHVQEKKNRRMVLSNSYNEQDKLTVSLILMSNNELFKNSKFLLQLGVGGRNELNVDYVKNFGELWGVYYRIFAYVNEKLLNVYNEDYIKTESVKSLEYGGTAGLGLFTKHHAIMELFLYSSDTGLYHDISENYLLPQHFIVTGVGLKAYHESIDDFVFPKRGLRSIGKLNFARATSVSDYIYSSFRGSADAYIPLTKNISTHLGVSLGTYLDSVNSDQFDPYPIGGIDGFRGYSRYAISSPHYLISTLSLSTNVHSKLFIDIGAQALKKGSDHLFNGNMFDEYCYFAGIGFRSDYLPLRAYIAFNDNKKINTMFSIGYDFDVFEFSRK
ncbi:MAG: patatin-like phospholipase family protein [Candidatus Cloacimonetes bacterium]|nr:patatin-like phospholipase family protein [Candidatus Cloacimonadota bacterium]